MSNQYLKNFTISIPQVYSEQIISSNVTNFLRGNFLVNKKGISVNKRHHKGLTKTIFLNSKNSTRNLKKRLRVQYFVRSVRTNGRRYSSFIKKLVPKNK